MELTRVALWTKVTRPRLKRRCHTISTHEAGHRQPLAMEDSLRVIPRPRAMVPMGPRTGCSLRRLSRRQPTKEDTAEAMTSGPRPPTATAGSSHQHLFDRTRTMRRHRRSRSRRHPAGRTRTTPRHLAGRTHTTLRRRRSHSRRRLRSNTIHPLSLLPSRIRAVSTSHRASADRAPRSP